MLKKRLLSSVMASIMAVSAFSVVTSADATATTTEAPVEETKAVKTKAELKAYVDTFDAKYKDDVYKFGTIAAERWLKAMDVAEVALNDTDATDKEISNAFYMLETATESNRQYTKDELEALIKKWTKVYDAQNILNADIGDNEYKVDKYADFEDAYVDATNVDKTNVEEITNVYVNLEGAANNLEKKSVVTKSQYTALIKRFETFAKNIDRYEMWRRGTTTVEMGGGSWTTDVNGRAVGAYTPSAYDVALTFGDVIYGYESTGKFNFTFSESWYPEINSFTTYYNIGSTGSGALYNAYDSIFEIEQVNRTTDDNIWSTYENAVMTISAIENFKVDSYNRSSKASVQKELDSNYADILTKLAPNALADLKASIGSGTTTTTAKAYDLSDSDDAAAFVTAGYATAKTTYTGIPEKYTKLTVGDVEKATFTADELAAGTVEVTLAAGLSDPYQITKRDLLDGTYTKVDTEKVYYTGSADIYEADDMSAAISASATSPLTTTGKTYYTKGTAITLADLKLANSTWFDDDTTLSAVGKEAVAGNYVNESNVIATEGDTYSANTDKLTPITKVVFDTTNSASVYLFDTTKVTGECSDDNSTYKAIASTEVVTAGTWIKKTKAAEVVTLTSENVATYATSATTYYATQKFEDERIDVAYVAGDMITVTSYDVGASTAVKSYFDATTGKLNTAGKEVLTLLSGLRYRVNKGMTVSVNGTTISAGKILDLSDYVAKRDIEAEIGDVGYTTVLDYLGYDSDDTTKATGTADYTGISGLTDLVDTSEGKADEWAVVYRKFKYLLNDAGIPLSSVSFSDLQKLITSSYDCDEIESAKFKDEVANIADLRKTGTDIIRNKDESSLSGTYWSLFNAIKAFNNKLGDYKYSYGEISDGLYAAYKNIDEGKYAIPDGYKDAADAVAYALIALIPSDSGEEAFDTYNELIPYARLYTDRLNSYSGTAQERALRDAYAKLADMTAKLEEAPEFAAGDVDGDGAIDSNDALLILDYSVDPAKVEGKTFHVEAADVNGDGSVNSLDAIAALDIAVKA